MPIRDRAPDPAINRMRAPARRRDFFGLAAAGTSARREIAAGATTFVTMAYIIAVNPAILAAAGIPAGPSMVATVATAVFGTLLMGLYANRPFAIAPYMGENAFVAFTVVRMLGFSWQTALGAVFLAGVLFIALTAARVRQWLLDAIPIGLRRAFAAGIGLFLAFVGLNESGLVTLGVPGTPVRIGNLASPGAAVALISLALICVLTIRRVPGAILLGIVGATFAGFAIGAARLPAAWVGMPPNPMPLVFALDIRGALTWRAAGVTLIIFTMALVDTMGTLVGLAAQAGLLDDRGHLPQIERPMMADAFATTFAALAGTTTAGAYVESAAGIAAGGRTGLTAVVAAALFAISLPFAPFVAAIPAAACGPALIVVGAMSLAPIVKMDFADPAESIPAFAVIALMAFTYNIGIGVAAGFILYTLCKTAAGKIGEIRPGLWFLTGLSALFFIFYPYH
jgi:AGZA family xanthine/uracil permease-like MFS transporter